MQIRRDTDYAIRCVLYLSELYDEVVMVKEIAKAKKIPREFLSKILQKLAKAGIVESFRGIKGGFRLAKRPEDINLLEVIEAIEGPVVMNQCAINRRVCSLSNSCSVHPVWVDVRKRVEGMLRSHNFAMLLDG